MSREKTTDGNKEESIATFYPTSNKQWRQWLQKNHDSKTAVWIECYKKNANMPTVVWSDAVDEALCFGWIDSTRKSVGNDKFIQYFCRRKRNSGWSKINKDKVQRLIEEGRMSHAGLRCIEQAKQDGSWAALDGIENLEIPSELNAVLRKNAKAKAYFTALSKSKKKMILHWITLAKRPETRQKRADEFVVLARENQLPPQFR
ncbi:YdeI/OmpD-associated family protein [Chryseolinea sp. T2]|uniref:YdeI/OmpD-associated family protein n=1 Tax=Chryseolinea sp. T2 TaxID=3129255 RepID=UPI003078858D